MICTIGLTHYAQATPVPKVMKEVIGLYVQIVLLRRGPQDLPVSRLLLILTVCGFVAVSSLVYTLLPSTVGWPLPLAVETLFLLAWYAALLQLTGRSERFLQTATGVFGFRAVLAPPLLASQWLLARYQHDAVWQLPIAVASLALVVWLIAANSHIVKHALDWSTAASVALVILQVVSGELVVLALFPPAAAA